MISKIIAFTSWGNDSTALIQWLIENKPDSEITALYSNTGWADPSWADRVDRLTAWAESKGVNCAMTNSEGMPALAKRKKSWPSNQFQFCTLELKILPAMAWLAKNDPNTEAICAVGVRRCESERRKNYPAIEKNSANHGGRDVYAFLCEHTDAMRDALLDRAGVPVLPHRSQECSPCINSNRADILRISEDRIAEIESLELSMGMTKNNKPRTLFRPHRFAGYPVGIRAVVEWAKDGSEKQEDLFSECSDAGWCGS
tara:strand:+ start:4436 stop:5206 length:771 start_codon:yes stop_codon:yes gene_type:complete